MSSVRRFTAPVSVIVLIVVAAVAFAMLRTGPTYPAPILDPSFSLWVQTSGQSRPMIWQFQTVKTPNDITSLTQTQIAGMNATAIEIVKNDRQGWSYVYLSQFMDGQRLAALFTMDIAVWVLKTVHVPQAALFGVEVNDGLHVLTFIFSDQPAEPQQFLAHRIIFLQTTDNTWVKQGLDFAGQYHAAGWDRPQHLTLSVVFAAGPNAAGPQNVFVNGFTFSQPKTDSSLAYFIGLLTRREMQ